MKNLGLSLVAILALGVAGTTPAYAGHGQGGGWICKILPFLCPPETGEDKDDDDKGRPPKSVPEPASLAILASGIAATIAARRRRDKNK